MSKSSKQSNQTSEIFNINKEAKKFYPKSLTYHEPHNYEGRYSLLKLTLRKNAYNDIYLQMCQGVRKY